ncbi:MAG: hypothetical protein ACFFCQ_17685, partial [Promethearchaeota archaeon]
MSEEHKRIDAEAEPRFDLRDGFGKEDIHAILIFLWNIIKVPLKIIIWPYIWIWRQLGRLVRFLKIKHDNALNEDERQFVESVPLFYTTIGVFAGLLWAILLALMWIPQELDVDLSDLGSVWDGIKKIFVGDDDTKGIFDYIGDMWGWFSDTVIDIGEGIADNPIAS